MPERGSKASVASSYFSMGVFHILSGVDHMLFVLALKLIVVDFKKLLKTITALTLILSATLALAALGLVNVPPAPTEAIIALSIVFLAVEIIHVKQGKYSLTVSFPWIVVMVFGLFHCLGFAEALSQIGLPPNEVPLAPLLFNVGVETGQVLFILVVLLVIAGLNKAKIIWPVWSWKLLPYAIGAIASFWVVQRTVSFL